MLREKNFGSRLHRSLSDTQPRRDSQLELYWMVLPDTRCPPSTHAARDWETAVRCAIRPSSVPLSYPHRTNPSLVGESRVPGSLQNQLQVWRQQPFGIGNRPRRAQRTRKFFRITTYNPTDRNASQATIRGGEVNCSQYGDCGRSAKHRFRTRRLHSKSRPGHSECNGDFATIERYNPGA